MVIIKLLSIINIQKIQGSKFKFTALDLYEKI